MFTLECHAGRLIEVRLATPVSDDEIAGADLAMAGLERGRGGHVIICADYTHLTVLPEQQAERLVAMFRQHNEHVAASAVLVASSSAVAVLQMERVIREAQNPHRRCFRSVRELQKWLGDHLTPAERGRADAFLSSVSADSR